MSDSALKNKIHKLVDNSDDEMLEAVYQLLQETEYTDEFKHILNEEFADYQANKKVISKDEVDSQIQDILKKK